MRRFVGREVEVEEQQRGKWRWKSVEEGKGKWERGERGGRGGAAAMGKGRWWTLFPFSDFSVYCFSSFR